MGEDMDHTHWIIGERGMSTDSWELQNIPQSRSHWDSAANVQGSLDTVEGPNLEISWWKGTYDSLC